MKLSRSVCAGHGWFLSEVRFYTGFPDAEDDPMWNRFWSKKLLAISRQGVRVFSRPLRYRDREIKDLSEVADEIRKMSAEQQRWIKMACAFPYREGGPNSRGINNSEWAPMDRAAYDACIDPFDYR
jgi:hypothetical protein